jgi:hypothetical protein
VAALLSNSWSRRGWVERLIGLALSPRERTIIEQLFREPTGWTASWWTYTTISLGLFAILGTAQWWILLPPRHEYGIGANSPAAILGILLIVPTLLIGEILAAILRQPLTREIIGFGSMHPVYPVGWREFRWAFRKSVWLRLGLCLPIALCPTLFDLPHSPANFLVGGLAVVSLLLCAGVTWETLGMLHPNQGAIGPDGLWDRRWLRLLPLLALVCVCGAGMYLTALAFIFGKLALVMPGWVLVIAGALGMQAYVEWVYHRTQLDFQCNETLILPQRRRGPR